MKTIVFAVAGYNLAETGRHIEIARACKELFNVIFISYGGQILRFIVEAGFTPQKMEPPFTDKQLRHVRKAPIRGTIKYVGYFFAG